jgi:hypothetical protein
MKIGSKPKLSADALIASETITSRGDKLLMRRVVIRDRYAQEPEELKAEVRQQHQIALEKWRQTCESYVQHRVYDPKGPRSEAKNLVS